MLQIAEFISYGLALYLLIGLIFGLYFIMWGVRNEPIKGMALILRAMLLPGAVLIWPLLMRRSR